MKILIPSRGLCYNVFIMYMLSMVYVYKTVVQKVNIVNIDLVSTMVKWGIHWVISLLHGVQIGHSQWKEIFPVLILGWAVKMFPETLLLVKVIRVSLCPGHNLTAQPNINTEISPSTGNDLFESHTTRKLTQWIVHFTIVDTRYILTVNCFNYCFFYKPYLSFTWQTRCNTAISIPIRYFVLPLYFIQFVLPNDDLLLGQNMLH